MPRPTRRFFVFNPHSRRYRRHARRLRRAIGAKSMVLPASLEALAQWVRGVLGSSEQPEIVVAAGDGTLHRVVNLVMKFLRQQPPERRFRPVIGVAPLGNANDGYITGSTRLIPGLVKRLYHLVVKPRVGPAIRRLSRDGLGTRALDLIRIRVTEPGGEASEVFAHGYAGFGVLATAAKLLNSRWRNKLTEIPLVLWALFVRYRPVVIERNGRVTRVAALLIMNIPRMAKVLWVSPQSRSDDGVLEVIEVPSGWWDRLRLFRLALRAGFGGKQLAVGRLVTEPIKLLEDTDVMLDGEHYRFAAGTVIEPGCEPGAIETFLAG